MIYDFHMHTTLSDGKLTPEELVELAKKAKVDVMCLTDHDTLLSMDKAKELDTKHNDITILGGLEVSTNISSIGRNAHILAYRCDTNNKALKDMLNFTTENRTQSFYKALDIIEKQGKVNMDKDKLEDYKGPNGFFGWRIMKYFFDMGYTEKNHSGLNRKLIYKAFNSTIEKIKYPECTKAIETIRKAGGIPIVAHTLFSDNFHAIDEMIEAGLMGIEVYHPRHSKDGQRMLREYCEQKNLLITCGSDFHRPVDDDNLQLGSTSVDSKKIKEFLSFIM